MPRTVRERSRRKQRTIKPSVVEASLPPDPRRWLALAVVLMATLLGVLDFFIVNVSIPAIQSGLGASFAQVQLMIAGYGLSYAVCLITGGRLGDIFGRKRMFMLGIAGFTLASILCGVAPAPGFLIGARVFQGVTAAIMFPQVLSIIQVSFPRHERTTAFGIFGVVAGTGSFSGNVLGGLLVQADLFGWGWRPIFLVNLPLGLLAFLAAAPLVRESRSPKAMRLDLGGVALASLGLFMLVYPLVQGRELGWPLWTFLSMAASLLVLAVFVLFEARVSARGGSPLVELGLFRDRVFVAGLVTTVVYYGGLSAFFLSFTVFLQDGLGLSPWAAGLTFTPFAIGFLSASSLAIKLTPGLGSRVISLGVALMAGALTAIVLLTRSRGTVVGSLELVPLLLIYGTGQGFVMPTLLSVVLSDIPTADAGSASGVLTTIQQVALAIGVALIGSIFFGVAGDQPLAPDFVRAIDTALLFNIGLLVIAFGLVFLLPRRLTGMQPAMHLEM